MAIHVHTQSSIGSNLELDFQNNTDYWKSMHITRSQFFDMVNTGDIILFKSKAFGAFALRVAMNS